MVNRAFNVSATNVAILLKLSSARREDVRLCDRLRKFSLTQAAHRHKREEVGRLWVQSTEMYIVEELCFGAKERNSGVERRCPGTTSGAWSRDASESARAPKPVAVSSLHLGHTRSRHWACCVPRLVDHRRCEPSAADTSDAGGSSHRHRSAKPTGGRSGE